MQRSGIKIDPGYFRAFSRRLDQEASFLERRMREMVGPFDPGSPQQVEEVLFERLKLRAGKRTKSGEHFSTDAKVLEAMAGAHPFVPLLLDHREVEKLNSTYARVLPAIARDDGRVHTNFRVTRVVSGRLSSTEPNLQNIPIRTELGREMRRGFVASPGYRLVSCDLSQIEARWCAHVSEDAEMMRIFWENLDIHSSTASRIFNLPIDQLDEKKHRYPAKRLNFGVIYGITARGLMIQIIMGGGDPAYWTEERCQQFIDQWFGLYPSVLEAINHAASITMRYGMIWDHFGRVRHLEQIWSSIRHVREEAKRQAFNHWCQAGAQGSLKVAMAALWSLIRDMGDEIRPLLQIHDELLFEVLTEIAEEFASLARDVVGNAVPLRVPVKAEAKTSEEEGNWAEMKKLAA